MDWILLVAAALLEIVWAIALKQSEGFTRLWPSLIGVTGAALSFGLLTLALRSLPVGTGYAAVLAELRATGVSAAAETPVFPLSAASCAERPGSGKSRNSVEKVGG